MTVALEVDERVLAEAIQVGGFQTRNEAVNEALKEFIDLKKRQEAFDYLMTVKFDDDWSPRKARGKREEDSY